MYLTYKARVHVSSLARRKKDSTIKHASYSGDTHALLVAI